MAFGENDSRICTSYAVHNMAILKRIAHNLLRQDRSLKVGIANKRLAAGWYKDYLCQLIGLKRPQAQTNLDAITPRTGVRELTCGIFRDYRERHGERPFLGGLKSNQGYRASRLVPRLNRFQQK